MRMDGRGVIEGGRWEGWVMNGYDRRMDRRHRYEWKMNKNKMKMENKLVIIQ